jgi:hypothetical protein
MEEIEQMAKKQARNQEGSELTSIRATKETTDYINDAIRVEGLATGKTYTQEEIIMMAMRAYFDKRIEEAKRGAKQDREGKAE